MVTNQIKGKCQTKEPQHGRYLNKVRTLVESFEYFQIEYIPREKNARTNLLLKLASTKKPRSNQFVIPEAFDSLIVDLADIQTVETTLEF